MKKKKIKCTSSKATGRCLYAYGNDKNKKRRKKKENKTLNVLGTFESEVTLSGGKNDRRRLPLNLLSLTEKKMFHCFSGNLQKSWDF